MDVTVQIQIAKPPSAVGRIMFEPANDPKWIGGAKTVDVLTPLPLVVGSRVRRSGAFMGKPIMWTTEVVQLAPDRLLRMTFVEGPMKGEVSYRIEPDGLGSRVSVRNAARAGFAFPGMGWMVKRSVKADLKQLKMLVEGKPR